MGPTHGLKIIYSHVLAYITGALLAKRGERGILHEARYEKRRKWNPTHIQGVVQPSIYPIHYISKYPNIWDYTDSAQYGRAGCNSWFGVKTELKFKLGVLSHLFSFYKQRNMSTDNNNNNNNNSNNNNNNWVPLFTLGSICSTNARGAEQMYEQII